MDDTGTRPPLSLRQRASWLAHLWKATTQQHHRDMRPLFARHLPADGVAFDVGAHAGQYARLMARMASRGRVYAFEPGSYPRSILERANRWRGFRNIEVVPRGLSDAPTSLDLVTPIKQSRKVGFGLAHMGDETRFDQVWRETVPVTTADAFVAEEGIDRLDLVKVDVEGWEARFIAGAADTLARLRPVLFLEIVAEHLANAGASPEDIFGPLAALGYTATRYAGTAPPSAAAAYDGPADYLFVPAQ